MYSCSSTRCKNNRKTFYLIKTIQILEIIKFQQTLKNLKDLSDQIKLISLMLGDGKKKISKAEKNNIKSMRRSIAVNQNFIKGQKIEKEQLIWLSLSLHINQRRKKLFLIKF